MRLAYAGLFVALTALPALAQRGPVIVVPGRPDVPVLMNGVDVSWAVIESDVGLARPTGVLTPTVIYRLQPVALAPYWSAALNRGPRFFPTTGKTPGYGRLEVQPAPDRPLPQPAQTYKKSWSSQSAPGPVTDYPPYAMPPVGIAIGGGDRHDHHHDDHGHHK
jgi:hypothetical protein